MPDRVAHHEYENEKKKKLNVDTLLNSQERKIFCAHKNISQ